MWNDMPKRWYEAYERGSPSYPPKAVGVPGVPLSATVLDLGAGTGKLTRLLVSTFFRVVAVEPDDEMRRLFVARCPDVEALTRDRRADSARGRLSRRRLRCTILPLVRQRACTRGDRSRLAPVRHARPDVEPAHRSDRTFYRDRRTSPGTALAEGLGPAARSRSLRVWPRIRRLAPCIRAVRV